MPSTLLGVLQVYHVSIYQYDFEQVVRFTFSLLIVFIPFCLFAEIGVQRRKFQSFEAIIVYLQYSISALVVFKYFVAYSFMGAFTYRGMYFYVVIEFWFMMIVVGSFVFGPHHNRLLRDRSGLSRVSKLATSIMACAIVFAFIQRRYTVIPKYYFPFLVVENTFEDESHKYGMEVFSEALAIDNPVQIIASPVEEVGFCVLTRDGRFYSVESSGEVYSQRLVFDLSNTMPPPVNELGVAGAVFGPKRYQMDGELFCHLFLYSAFEEGGKVRSCLDSYKVSLPEIYVDLKSKRTLINQDQPDGMHNGGGLLFGSDGYLYLGIGDGGPENDLTGASQKIDESLLSGIFRIDVYGDDMGKVKAIENRPLNGETSGYWIPKDNPFVGREGALEEFWAIGLRNPFRLTILPGSESLLVGDVGQSFLKR